MVSALFFVFLMIAEGAATGIQKEKLNDGVQRWYRSEPKERKPWFFLQVEKLFQVVLPEKNKLPFGKSVAFLVGVSEYGHITPQLPFVKNDLSDLRDFLLDKGGFDEVYVAADQYVTGSLVEKYMMNTFREMRGASHLRVGASAMTARLSVHCKLPHCETSLTPGARNELTAVQTTKDGRFT